MNQQEQQQQQAQQEEQQRDQSQQEQESVLVEGSPRITTKKPAKQYIRGVNLGGWLVLERYITPYTFAITDCHQRGDLCWYPGQIDAPPGDAPLCHLNVTATTDVAMTRKEALKELVDAMDDSLLGTIMMENATDSIINNANATSNATRPFCEPVLHPNVFGANDYPMDEWHLSQAFSANEESRQAGTDWLNHHFEHFLKKQDILDLQAAGITHLRVPLPHWILGDIDRHEPWIAGDRWKYFLRLCEWVREINAKTIHPARHLQLWPNIHTAPGSQNGFDNSGVQNTVKTCGGWADNPHNVQRSLDVLLEVAVGLKEANVLDVVTGFGLLNEPFGDCNRFVYEKFLEDGITIVRRILGDDIYIYMSDLFQASLYNNGIFGRDPVFYKNTFLDSHYYHIFSPEARSMPPDAHVYQVCNAARGERVEDCCFLDEPTNKVPLPEDGTKRIVAEWTGAFDAMPGEVLKPIMKGIYEHGVAPLMDRQLSEDRKSFLTKFLQSQIVSYEAASVGDLSYGWFYWNFKMEGGGYIEWDMRKYASCSCLGSLLCCILSLSSHLVSITPILIQ